MRLLGHLGVCPQLRPWSQGPAKGSLLLPPPLPFPTPPSHALSPKKLKEKKNVHLNIFSNVRFTLFNVIESEYLNHFLHVYQKVSFPMSTKASLFRSENNSWRGVCWGCVRPVLNNIRMTSHNYKNWCVGQRLSTFWLGMFSFLSAFRLSSKWQVILIKFNSGHSGEFLDHFCFIINNPKTFFGMTWH